MTLDNQMFDRNRPLRLFICAVISSVHICELPCASACTPKLAPRNKTNNQAPFSHLRLQRLAQLELPEWCLRRLSLPGEAPLIGHLFFHLSWEALCNFGKLATRSQHLTQRGQTLVPNLPAVSEAGLPVRL